MIRTINIILTRWHPKNCRQIVTNTSLMKMKQETDASTEREESLRMRQFHEKLKLQPIPKMKQQERFVDLMLVETDSSTGELIADSEREPTKWGDWQHGGRVTDF